MRRTLLALLLLTALAAPAAAAPKLELETHPAFAGAPLRLDVAVDQWSAGRGLVVDVFLDGTHVATRTVYAGENALEFPEVELASGSHEVMVKLGSQKIEGQIHVLPGWLTVLPPLLAILLALVTRDVLISLSLGVFSGAMILNGWNPFTAFARTVDQFLLGALADGDHAAIIIFTLFLGGMVGLLTKSGGTHGIVEMLRPYATTGRRGQVATWCMGVLIFFDDYANTLIVGPTMRPITDKLRVSREKLAYVVDSTAAPVVCLIPISTWVGFEIGLIADAFAKLQLPFDAYTTFLASIPYRFYPIFALVLGFTLASSGIDFGPMRRAEERTRRTGDPLGEDAEPIAEYGSQATEPPADIPKRALNAFLPILTVVAVTVLGLYVTGAAGLERTGDTSNTQWVREVLANANSFKALMWGSLSGMLMALILPLVQRLLSLRDAMGAMVEGFRSMLLALVVLILAWGIGAVCDDLQTAHYLVGLVEGVVSPLWLPALTFVLAALVAFSTGSSWGTMAILTPLVIPIAHKLATGLGVTSDTDQYFVLLTASIASVLAGAVWGDHCSPISDTTILSSMATGCDHIAHVRTQLPYAFTIGIVAILIGSIPATIGLRPWVSLLVGTVLIVGTVLGANHLRNRRAQAESSPDSEA